MGKRIQKLTRKVKEMKSRSTASLGGLKDKAVEAKSTLKEKAKSLQEKAKSLLPGSKSKYDLDSENSKFEMDGAKSLSKTEINFDNTL